MKKSLFKLIGAILALAVACSVIQMTVFAEAEPIAEAGSFTTGYSFTNESGEFAVLSFENTVETKDVVATYEIINDRYYFFAQKASGASSGYLVYSFADKYITSFSADMLTVNGFIYTTTVTDYLKVEALVEGETDYVNVPLSTTEYQQLNDNGAYSFFTSTVSNTSALPEKTVNLKVTIDPTYTTYLDYNVRIDNLTIGYKDIPMEEPTNVLVDNFENLTVSTTNVGVQALSDTDTGFTVVGRIPSSEESYLTYKVTEGKAIKNFKLDVQTVNGFINAIQGVKLEYKILGNDSWNVQELAQGETADITEISSTGYDFRLEEVLTVLPDNVTEIKISLINDSAFAFLNQLDKLELGIVDIETSSDVNFTIKDILKLKKHINSIETDIDVSVMDLEADGVIDGKDLAKLRSILISNN